MLSTTFWSVVRKKEWDFDRLISRIISAASVPSRKPRLANFHRSVYSLFVLYDIICRVVHLFDVQATPTNSEDGTRRVHKCSKFAMHACHHHTKNAHVRRYANIYSQITDSSIRNTRNQKRKGRRQEHKGL